MHRVQPTVRTCLPCLVATAIPRVLRRVRELPNDRLKNLQEYVNRYDKLPPAVDSLLSTRGPHSLPGMILKAYTTEGFNSYVEQVYSRASVGDLEKVTRNLAEKGDEANIDSFLDGIAIYNDYNPGDWLSFPKVLSSAIHMLPGVRDNGVYFKYSKHPPLDFVTKGLHDFITPVPISVSKFALNPWRLKKDVYHQYVFDIGHEAGKCTADLEFLSESGIDEHEVLISPLTHFKHIKSVDIIKPSSDDPHSYSPKFISKFSRDSVVAIHHFKYYRSYLTHSSCSSHHPIDHEVESQDVIAYEDLNLLVRIILEKWNDSSVWKKESEP